MRLLSGALLTAARFGGADDRPPPWYRPAGDHAATGWNRHCDTCGVQWRGDEPCWMCGGEKTP